MRNPFDTPFVAVFQNEVLLNSKRVAPYALILIFIAAALMGWTKGPALALGWATNSDFYIARSLKAFSFLLGPPLFNAVIMGDPVIRDFRLGIDPLIFSRPINRAQYLFGKFFGNFFVLVCCQAVFPLTLMVLQAFRPSRMVVQQTQVLPYFKHFFFFVVITHLALAAFYFTVGALTRNSKIVYGLAICFYPIYISFMLFLIRPLTIRWRNFLDLFLLNSGPSNNGFGNSADFLNRYVMSYTPDMIGNRLLLILAAVICLTVLYVRFRIAERPGNFEQSSSMLRLSTATDQIFFDRNTFQETRPATYEEAVLNEKVKLPSLRKINEGFRSILNKLGAALVVEFRLVRTERSLVVLAPLVVFISIFDLAFYRVVPETSYSAAYASSTAKTLLLFLLGMTVFYTGEAMHRDRDLIIEPVLWSLPVPNNVLLLSKLLGTLVLVVSLVVLVGITALAVQIIKWDTPVNVSAYLLVYSVILLPNVVFMAATSVALNVLLRDKYVTYAVSIGIGAGLFYLYGQGYNHWLYNPLLYQLWNYPDLTGAGTNRATILMHRIYWLAIAGAMLALAHLFFERRSTKELTIGSRLRSNRWSISILVISAAIALIAGLAISGRG